MQRAGSSIALGVDGTLVSHSGNITILSVHNSTRIVETLATENRIDVVDIV